VCDWVVPLAARRRITTIHRVWVWPVVDDGHYDGACSGLDWDVGDCLTAVAGLALRYSPNQTVLQRPRESAKPWILLHDVTAWVS
jgi:hypothetical protein